VFHNPDSQIIDYTYHPMPKLDVKFPGRYEVACSARGGFTVAVPNKRGTRLNVTIRAWEDFIDNRGVSLATCTNMSTTGTMKNYSFFLDCLEFFPVHGHS
jgi:hypothetical protein